MPSVPLDPLCAVLGGAACSLLEADGAAASREDSAAGRGLHGARVAAGGDRVRGRGVARSAAAQQRRRDDDHDGRRGQRSRRQRREQPHAAGRPQPAPARLGGVRPARRGKPGGGALVEARGEVLARARRDGRRGPRPARRGRTGRARRRRPAQGGRRAPRARGPRPGRSRLTGDMAGLPELGHGACRRVPALDSLPTEHRGDLGVGPDRAGTSARRARARAVEAWRARRAPRCGAARRGRRRRRRSAVTSGGSATSGRWRLRRRSSSSAALRAMPNSQARRSPAGLKRARLRYARSNAAP